MNEENSILENLKYLILISKKIEHEILYQVVSDAIIMCWRNSLISCLSGNQLEGTGFI